MHINCNGRILDLSSPVVMGVLNITPDSFSDGGQYIKPQLAIERARQMIAEGAAIIDIGGESTRPGAEPVPEQQELERVLPVIERLAGEIDAVISIDTMKPAVMLAACEAGATLINDVNALRAEGALQIAKETGAGVCLMHMLGEPRTMQKEPAYHDVTEAVTDFLRQRLNDCITAGFAPERILLDPGFGFGKTLAHNLQLLAELNQLAKLGRPLLVGVSRKSMFGTLLDLPAHERVHGGVAAASLAVWQGASIIRSHDVRATTHAVKVASAIKDYRIRTMEETT